MNRSRASELLPIIEAFANGEDLEFRLIGKTGWMMFPKNEELTITFPAGDYEYRIKPSPREFWIARYPDNETSPFVVYDGAGPPTALHNRIWIKVREVLA